ncbi:hypothetical protein JCM3766R1_001600 [Sporobolomyces carnicolor]
MSAPPHDGWPKVGDIFPHWSDLQLAILLAALRAGYNTIGRHWDAKSPDRLYMPSIIDAYLGDYPVLPCGEDGKPIRPIVADVRLSAKLETRRSVLSKALESLAVARRTHLVTNTKLFTAEIADSVDEANKLKIEVAAAAKQVRKKERKVGRKRAKVERMKERIEKDKMERIEKDKMERRKLAGQEAKKPKLKKEKKKDQQKSNVTET